MEMREWQCIQPQSSDGADAHGKMCGCEASKCGRNIPPSQIGSGGKVCFLRSGRRKISPGGNFRAINSDRLLDCMSHDSLFMYFLGYMSKNVFSVI
jgi:hypothetical protein